MMEDDQDTTLSSGQASTDEILNKYKDQINWICFDLFLTYAHTYVYVYILNAFIWMARTDLI